MPKSRNPGTDKTTPSEAASKPLPDAIGSADADRLRPEQERLAFERQKLAIEVRLKRRELRENRKKPFRDLLTNPLTLAVAGGFITLMTSIVTASYTANQNRESDDHRARQALQAELIKKFVEAPTTEKVRENLMFLVKSKLLPDYGDGIAAYLQNNPRAAPSIGANFGDPRPKFEAQAASLVRSLVEDFNLKDFQAAAIIGNIAYNTAGFRVLDQIPFGGRGGIGYLMWTGPRRREFEAFVQSKGLDPASMEANYAFLKQELETTFQAAITAVKAATTLGEATRNFQERAVGASPGNLNYDHIIAWAQLALNAYRSSPDQASR